MRRPVIPLHHTFTRRPGIQQLPLLAEPESAGNRHLQVKQQTVFCPLCLDMQTDADILERPFLLAQLLRLRSRQQPLFCQLVP